jgi:hypothetical protein
MMTERERYDDAVRLYAEHCEHHGSVFQQPGWPRPVRTGP